MSTLFLDLETFSDVPITNGTYAYAERAEVLLVAWAWGDDPVEVWDTADRDVWEDWAKPKLQGMIDDGNLVNISGLSIRRP